MADMKVLVFNCRKVLEINCRKLLDFTCFLQPFASYVSIIKLHKAGREFCAIFLLKKPIDKIGK
ncbi:MAG: hypothetical protein IKW90_06785 [Lachnospiraceae bacterium]|nr:hypothetical protein [Lachnospiraceae bacterium]